MIGVWQMLRQGEFPDIDGVPNYVRVCKRRLRFKMDVMDIPDKEFQRNFRMNKETFTYILGKIKDKFEVGSRSTHVLPVLKLVTFLRFMATGNYQKGVGNEYFCSISQSKVSLIIDECLMVFEESLCPMWIVLNMSEEEEFRTKLDFNEKNGFPGVVGCVDGTLIKIIAPKEDVRHLYYCRKGYYSINAMMICDSKMMFRYVDARHPGANHDSFVWSASLANDYFKRRYIDGRRNTWLLGDGGYMCQPYLLTPYRNPTTSTQNHYNLKQSKTRNIIERCYGVVKNRFRVLNSERGLHYAPEKATKIINVACALHNICTHYRNELPSLQNAGNATDSDGEWTDGEISREASRIRDEVANSLA